MSQTTPAKSTGPEVLYIHMAAFGDAIMASPAFALLKSARPDVRLTVIARTQAKDYFSRLPQVDRIIPFVAESHVDRRRPWRLLGAGGDLTRLVRELRGTPWAAGLQWRSQLPDTLMNALSRAEHRIVGLQRIHRPALLGAEKLRFLFTEQVPLQAPDAHLVDAFALPVRALLARWGVELPAENPRLVYPVSEADRRSASEFLLSCGLGAEEQPVMVNISAKSEFNQWSEENFAALGDGLAGTGFRVLLSGLPEHREREIAIASRMKHPPVLSTGRLSMGAVAGVLERCRVLVALNTGIAHVAAALQVPVVVLNGRDGASITPWRSPHRIVTHNTHYPHRHPDPAAWSGLVPLIKPSEVIAAVRELAGSASRIKP
ncbi:glycosyltransferase family 9 protein [Nibricoccus sp. IMCC34717]|uniref:glycosyltransferase family 9 protein n=1 Tax=Nibricoccus sp. IMCC34717 TaxID=3034021 RepID=UPI00384AC17B